MPPQAKYRNPFFHLLGLVGVLFCLSGWVYYLMMIRTAAPANGSTDRSSPGPLIELMQHHGLAILASELGLLAATAVAAMATDNYWARRAERRRNAVHETTRRAPVDRSDTASSNAGSSPPGPSLPDSRPLSDQGRCT